MNLIFNARHNTCQYQHTTCARQYQEIVQWLVNQADQNNRRPNYIMQCQCQFEYNRAKHFTPLWFQLLPQNICLCWKSRFYRYCARFMWSSVVIRTILSRPARVTMSRIARAFWYVDLESDSMALVMLPIAIVIFSIYITRRTTLKILANDWWKF